MNETRTYNSPTRERAKAETRAKIVQAVVRVVLDDGIPAFTVQNVADKAGVSHRTVYRHFESREELLDGLADALDRMSAESSLPTTPEELEHIVDGVGPAFLGMGQNSEAMRAYVIGSIALQWQDEGRKRRTRAFEQVIRAAFPHLRPTEVREAGGVIRQISGSRCWYELTAEEGLGAAAAARAVEWAVRTLIGDLRRRNTAAKKRESRS